MISLRGQKGQKGHIITKYNNYSLIRWKEPSISQEEALIDQQKPLISQEEALIDQQKPLISQEEALVWNKLLRSQVNPYSNNIICAVLLSIPGMVLPTGAQM